MKNLKGYTTLKKATHEKFDKITKMLQNVTLSIFEEIRKARKVNKNLQNRCNFLQNAQLYSRR